jgi:hypothetical protein
VTRELNITKTAFLEGMKKLKECANKCVGQGGMYFEGRKKKNYVHIRSYLCFITLVLKLLGLTLYVLQSEEDANNV